MAKSPDETLVISGSADGGLRLWNIEEGRMVSDPWEGHDGPVNCLDWSPNTLEIASGSQDGTIRRWNPDTGRQIAPLIKTSHGCLYTVKYSPQDNKFASGGEDKVIRVWSMDGVLLMEINGHDRYVMSLRWSKDGAHIFSASYDNTIRKWRSIDGKELVVFRGHTYGVENICLSPDERHLVSASSDRSVRIWDLETNQPVGDPLLHDDGVLALTIFPDGKYIASGGMDAKIYVWSMDAARKQQGNDDSADESNVEPDVNLKGRPVRPRHHQPHNKGLSTYGEDFWGTDPTHTRAASPVNSSALRWRNFLGLLRFSIRPANTPQSIPTRARRRNFNLFPVGNSIRTVDVAAGKKKQRIAISPPTAAELAAAMQRQSGNNTGSSTQPGQPQTMPGTQLPQGQPTVAQGASGGMEEVSCEVRCCSLFFSCGRSTSHK
jgi:WD40 repeat protein